MDDQKELTDICDKISKETMRPLVTQKENVYLDADLLFDFKLGSLLSLIKKGKEDYDYIMSQLPKYLDAPSLDCARFFPELGYTDEDLLVRAQDPKYQNVLAAIAPATRVLEDLIPIIRILNTINISKETQRPIRVTINQRVIMLHPFLKRRIRDIVNYADNHAFVEFTDYPSWFHVPESMLKCQDVIGVYDIKEFVATGSTPVKLFMNTNELAMTDIIALKQSDLSEEKTPTGLKNLEDVMGMMCNKFTFINKSLLTKDHSNG